MSSIIRCGMGLVIRSKFQEYNSWRLGMEKKNHPTLYWECDYLSMLIKGTPERLSPVLRKLEDMCL